jgi:hypothetical protein
MKRLLLLIAVCVGVSSAYLKAYEVTPTQANWSGTIWGDPDYGGVGNTFTANFDSAAEVQFFVGHVGDTSHHYNVDVYDWPDVNNPLAHSYNIPAPAQGHIWLKFPLTTVSGQKFVRGKEYLLKVTRPGDSVNYYFGQVANGGPYQYGEMVVGGTPQGNKDLCLRLYGKARVGGEFAVQSLVGTAPPDTSLRYSANWRTCIQREKEIGVLHDKTGYGVWYWAQMMTPDSCDWSWFDTLMVFWSEESIQPTMAFRGLPRWASCGLDNFNYDTSGSCIPRSVYQPVLDPTDSVINDNNVLAKWAYEFVRRYGPKGRTFNQSLSGTFCGISGTQYLIHLP